MKMQFFNYFDLFFTVKYFKYVFLRSVCKLIKLIGMTFHV